MSNFTKIVLPSSTGEFFLSRYRKMDSEVEIIEPEDLQKAIRVNTAKITEAKLIDKLRRRDAMLEKIDWLSHGYSASARFSMGSTPEYLLGYYYLQSPLSQLACEVLSPDQESEVLDMAAAPGGKTTYLATMAKRVIALDLDARRLAAVRNNVERLGLTNVICLKKDARYAFDLGRKFGFVLLDAPCSGNFCSEPGWFSKRTIDDVRKNARMQRELLRSAVQCLDAGGRLLYSTCSLEPEENEVLVDWALHKFPELDLVHIDAPIGSPGTLSWEGVELDSRLSRTRRFWPHKTGFEGFFMALFEKKK